MMAKKPKLDGQIKAEEGKSEVESQPTTEPEEVSEVPAIIPEEEIAQLRAELDQALVKQDEYLGGWQRERAEFFNYKKRMEREQTQGGQNAFASAIRRYLDIADDLERALKNNNRPTDGNGAIWAEGIDLIYRKLVAAFEADGVKRIDKDCKFFDPNLHEAISHEDSPEHESGQIIEVVQPGYTLGERVIRPARVRVAR
ncbi:MAG: nucleotide exchange factor GrpE [Anaerolineales bacterium]